MLTKALVSGEIQESIAVKTALLRKSVEVISQIADLILERLKDGKKLIIFGNGGSAADAQHLAAEFVGRYRSDREPLPAIALTTNTSVLTAVGNDYGFAEVFARQISALGEAGDVALAMSTSGNSPNVLRGLQVARERGLLTVGLTGGTGGKMKALVDICLCVPSDLTPRIQESHSLVAHIISCVVEDSLVAQAGREEHKLLLAH